MLSKPTDPTISSLTEEFKANKTTPGEVVLKLLVSLKKDICRTMKNHNPKNNNNRNLKKQEQAWES